jgi:hypothetical protein
VGPVGRAHKGAPSKGNAEHRKGKRLRGCALIFRDQREVSSLLFFNNLEEAQQ